MAVNWQRWVTSWRASHSRNWRGSNPCSCSRATTLGPTKYTRSWSSTASSVSSRSYWPRTLVDSQPRTRPIWVPVATRPALANGPASRLVTSLVATTRVGSNRSRWGPTRRWKLETLACTHPARSVTRARAGPEDGSEPGGRRHQLLGLGGQLLEVGLEEVGPVRGGQVAATPHPSGHPFGGVPGHCPAAVGGPVAVRLGDPSIGHVLGGAAAGRRAAGPRSRPVGCDSRPRSPPRDCQEAGVSRRRQPASVPAAL